MTFQKFLCPWYGLVFIWGIEYHTRSDIVSICLDVSFSDDFLDVYVHLSIALKAFPYPKPVFWTIPCSSVYDFHPCMIFGSSISIHAQHFDYAICP